MALSWNEIKSRALQFSREWAEESRERAEKDSFYNEFFHIFGISRKRVATFEQPVKKLNNKTGFIDLFWKGTLIVEHKSKGKDLDGAYEQATDYFQGLKEHEIPKYILVSDFERFRLYDLEEKSQHEFHITKLHENVRLFGFMAGYSKSSIFKEQDPVNIEAAELMGKLHDQLKASGYEGHPLEVMLVRLLFCLFAEDTGIFQKDTFREFIDQKTNEDGSNLGALLAQFFQVLDTPIEKRLKNLDETLNEFPYVNGKLFEEFLPISSFNSEMREILLTCSKLDWGKISPAIFGSMFQSVMNPQERRNLGAHYTSEKNILRLIKPLFLDELHEEFHKIKSNKKQLLEFHKKLASLKFFDPACGCGNFLIITYRELRLLELEVLKKLHGTQQAISIQQIAQVDVDQFYGIEYDEFPARIAEVAMWLIDHQMNIQISEAFGQYYARLPLKKSATIVHGNALRQNWNQIIAPHELSYILGNPPFLGSRTMNKIQKAEIKDIFPKTKGKGELDYVTAWYKKSKQFILNTNIQVAFVSTNSICQGLQTSILWQEILSSDVEINFAHTTFKWSNEAKGKAAVYCIIVGFGKPIKDKTLFVYDDIQGEPSMISVKHINPYLTTVKNVFITSRNLPICEIPKMSFGNMPADGGKLLFTDDEKNEFMTQNPESSEFFRPLISAREFLNKQNRWCLWLKAVEPSKLKKSKAVLNLIQEVKVIRENSSRPQLANIPMLFAQITQDLNSDFILIPRHSSERRQYIPIGFFDKKNIAHDSCLIVSNATLFHFGVLTSKMHMTWVKYTCGRLESRFRYSKDIVYNNYPFPKEPTAKNQSKVEKCAQKVLDVRAEFPDNSLADLYDPLTMPPQLVKTHQALDKAVDLCYRPQAFTTESNRIEFLFDLYHQYVTPLLETEKQKQKRVRKAKKEG